MALCMTQASVAETIAVYNRTPSLLSTAWAASSSIRTPAPGMKKSWPPADSGSIFSTLVSYPEFVAYVVKMMASDEPSIDREKGVSAAQQIRQNHGDEL